VKRSALLVIGSRSPTKSATRARSSSRRGLEGKVRIVDGGQTLRVRTAFQCPPDLGLRRFYAARQHKCRIPKVDKCNVTSVGNAPTMSEFSRKACLPPLGNLRCYDAGHACIVADRLIQGEGGNRRSVRFPLTTASTQWAGLADPAHFRWADN